MNQIFQGRTLRFFLACFIPVLLFVAGSFTSLTPSTYAATIINDHNLNWAGYVVQLPSPASSKTTSATGNYTVPSLNCHNSSGNPISGVTGTWVGQGGYGNNGSNLFQIGSGGTCNNGQPS